MIWYIIYTFFHSYIWTTVFDVIQSPPLCLVLCKFDKILVVGNFIEQNFILKILVLEITSRKIFLIFLSIRYDTAIIIQSTIFWKFFLISLLSQALNVVSLNNIFLVFFLYIQSLKVNSNLIIIRNCFCSVNSISIGSFYSSFSSKLLLYILLKLWQLVSQLSKFFKLNIWDINMLLLHYNNIRQSWCEFRHLN